METTRYGIQTLGISREFAATKDMKVISSWGRSLVQRTDITSPFELQESIGKHFVTTIAEKPYAHYIEFMGRPTKVEYGKAFLTKGVSLGAEIWRPLGVSREQVPMWIYKLPEKAEFPFYFKPGKPTVTKPFLSTALMEKTIPSQVETITKTIGKAAEISARKSILGTTPKFEFGAEYFRVEPERYISQVMGYPFAKTEIWEKIEHPVFGKPSIVKVKQKQRLKQIGIEKGLETISITRQTQLPSMSERQLQFISQRPIQLQKPLQKQFQKQKQKQAQALFMPSIPIVPISPKPIKISPPSITQPSQPLIPPVIPLFPIFGHPGKPRIRRRKKPKRKLKYRPSIAGIVVGRPIKKAPKGLLTGFEINVTPQVRNMSVEAIRGMFIVVVFMAIILYFAYKWSKKYYSKKRLENS